MPVYLCQPGSGATEPWRHGIQVYATPFALDEAAPLSTGVGRDVIVLPATSNESARWSDEHRNEQQQLSTGEMSTSPDHDGQSQLQSASDAVASSSTGQSQRLTETSVAAQHQQHRSPMGVPIRRVRHAEVVLVDDVCVAHDRYWLRLRWPGHNGGFAGYIALGRVGQASWFRRINPGSSEIAAGEETGQTTTLPPDPSYVDVHSSIQEEERVVTDEVDTDDPAREDEPQDNASTRSSEPFESTSALTCLRTGLTFPSSVAMQLMPVYDDGFSPPVTSAPLPSEPVFCRICREGLHDDADEQQPSPAMENETEENTPREQSNSPSPNPGAEAVGEESSLVGQSDVGEQRDIDRRDSLVKGPVIPHPTYHPNPHAAENPILAPCECAGSMAFVHYLCVEQWRCRSRHPEARHGLHCETCGSAYALPPPSARPANLPQVDNDDWLEAMPPHVMAALRQPHVWWQIGAAIVRRRWLRPIAPVIMSPLVALYCRARRLLKKKGVARRRWACSLCRRRARWKCVRCLRSYYCSRQCQNVSWHIVHKHVCYKPMRFWWSVVVYGVATLVLFPGILRDPLMYDLGLGFVPASFYIMGILGGGIATLLKKSVGLDLRGRTFEMVVILLTVWLVATSWGLVGAFFGDSSQCYGVFGSQTVSSKENPSLILKPIRRVVLQPAKSWFLMWDRLGQNSGPWLRKALCTSQPGEGCFEHLPKANPDFFLDEFGGGRCASDLMLVAWLYISAGIVALGNSFWKRRERHRRAARRPARDEHRPHQD